MTGAEVAEVTPDRAALNRIAEYQGYFGRILPVKFRPETFVSLAQGVLRKDPALMRAAIETPASLMVALLDCSRLGHEPGTPDYYLTPREVYDKTERRKRWEIVGIEGYKGIVKRMLQHPTVLSVQAQVVFDGDRFEYVPGVHKVPILRPGARHTGIVDWFADRGKLLGSYAYAVLSAGEPSSVVVIGPRDIERAKKRSASASAGHGSPWDSDEDTMVLKTALRRLEKFVAKSSEVIYAQAERTARAQEIAVKENLPELPAGSVDDPDGEGGERVLEGEVVEEVPADNFGTDPTKGNSDD
jgi:recombination protein RecT